MHRGGKRSISWPMLCQTIKLPVGGTTSLQSAFHLNSQLDPHGLLNKATSSQQKLCEYCDKEQANGYCSQCEQFLYQECTIAHKKWKMFASHKIISMKCTSHNMFYSLKFYCDTCKQSICHHCTVKQHHDHQFNSRHTQKKLLLKTERGDSLGSSSTACVNSPIRSFTGFKNLQGIAIAKDGNIIALDLIKNIGINYIVQIVVFDPTSGKEILRFGDNAKNEGMFMTLTGVAVTQNNELVVTNAYKNQVQLFTQEGVFIKSVGSKGNGPLQFQYPCHVAIHHNGKLFICEEEGKRVQVLNPDLSFSRCFGSTGSDLGQFESPCSIAFDSQGMVYVSDQNRLQKLTSEGEYVAVIDGKDTEVQENGSIEDSIIDGSLYAPDCVVIDNNDIIYVSDSLTETLNSYNTSGEFLGIVNGSDGESIEYPYKMAVDASGAIYIEKNRTQIDVHYMDKIV